MKICVDCKHYKPTKFADMCESPNNGISLVTGEIKVGIALVNRKAIPSGKCGPDAKWFEPKITPNPKKRFWIF